MGTRPDVVKNKWIGPRLIRKGGGIRKQALNYHLKEFKNTTHKINSRLKDIGLYKKHGEKSKIPSALSS